MTLNERYRVIYARLYGFKDHCDEQHHHVMRELESELAATRNAIIEECAKICDDESMDSAEQLARRIRALKQSSSSAALDSEGEKK